MRFLLPLLLFVAACGVDPSRVAGHTLAADDGDEIASPRPITFGVVGNLRDAEKVRGRATGRAIHPGVADAIAEDLVRAVDSQDLAWVTLMGDDVPAASTGAWRRFDHRMHNLLAGSTLADAGRKRVPTLPVAGDREFQKDRQLRSYEAAFPGVGVNIGFKRVASWYAFDVRLAKGRWRFLVLDTNKRALGPRWQEQLYWIPKAVEGKDYDGLVVFMHHPLQTLALGGQANREGAPGELLELVEDTVELMKLRAVFTADPYTSEAFLVGGRFGTLHVNAGGGGAGASTLARWGVADERNSEALKLETVFDLSLLKAFNQRAQEREVPENIIDAARAERSWEGFPGQYDAKYFPLYGWWRITLRAEGMEATFRLYDLEGGFQDVYRVDYVDDEGWRTGSRS
ncbi:MAG: hypothetical protein JXB39_00715 [Deltaproteobacteria bacterium]|nr:hypothetical protein [Deltaproteobacteria bacterium]